MRPNRLTGLTALVAAATLGLAACGATSPTSAAPPQNAAASSASSDTSSMPGMTTGSGAAAASGPAAAAAATQVQIQGFAFKVSGPVPAGSTVTVRNEDNVAHTVTSDTAGQFDVTVAAHATATFTAPQTAGSYAMHCTFHPRMHGELVVR